MHRGQPISVDAPEGASSLPWGWSLAGPEIPGMRTCVLCVSPGRGLPLLMHALRSELWTVVCGEGVCTVDGRASRISPHSTVYIPAGAAHRVDNPSQADDLVISEVQMGVCDDGDAFTCVDGTGRAVAAAGDVAGSVDGTPPF